MGNPLPKKFGLTTTQAFETLIEKERRKQIKCVPIEIELYKTPF